MSGRSEAVEIHAPSNDDESGAEHMRDDDRAGPSSRAVDWNRCRRTDFQACGWVFGPSYRNQFVCV